MNSMLDLPKQTTLTVEQEYRDYIYGSADVVGSNVFVSILSVDNEQYEDLKDSAKSLGSAFFKR
jgi:phytoene/squalene synthetase